MVAMLQAFAISRVPSVVRVPANDAAEIGRTLDAGADGVIVPLVETAEEAERAVAACRYAPAGARSWGALRPSLHIEGYDPATGDAHAACIVLIETERGAHNADEIASVPGVDALYIGPNDLALTAGLPPSYTFEEPRHRALVERIVAAGERAGIPVGTHARGPEHVREYLDAGFRLLVVHRDLPELVLSGRSALAAAQEAAAAPA
jgi:4-hydroxy-2-oxoheptanedioate aldolase